jgi:aminomethyltransferase
VARAGAPVSVEGAPAGVLTSGGFGPTLGRGIGLARLDCPAEDACSVAVRGRELPARLVRPPFVRAGAPAVHLPPLTD